MRLTGYSAIEFAEKHNLTLSKHGDSVDEPASGLTRAVLVLLCEAYRYDESRPSKEYFAFKPELAPIKAGVFRRVVDHVHALVPGQPGGLGDPVVGVEAVDEEQAGGGHPCS